MTKLIFSIFFLILIPLSGKSQSYLKLFPKDLLLKANTAKEANYLTEDEKLVILIMNIARINGPLFVKNILNNQTSGNSTPNFKSLINDLNNTKDIEPFLPANGLHQSSEYHAKDMGEKGTIGHQSSDGTSTFVRIRRYAQGGYMAENCAYGSSDPLAIVLQLLIDEGVSSLGHRKSILSKDYSYVGVSIQPHSTYGYNCVQDFSDTGD